MPPSTVKMCVNVGPSNDFCAVVYIEYCWVYCSSRYTAVQLCNASTLYIHRIKCTVGFYRTSYSNIFYSKKFYDTKPSKITDLYSVHLYLCTSLYICTSLIMYNYTFVHTYICRYIMMPWHERRRFLSRLQFNTWWFKDFQTALWLNKPTKVSNVQHKLLVRACVKNPDFSVYVRWKKDLSGFFLPNLGICMLYNLYAFP